MSAGLGRLLASLRIGTRDPRSGGKYPGQSRSPGEQTQGAVLGVYADALVLLGKRRATGHLDSDLAIKAAQRLGRVYRERQQGTP
jgi:hypothetical protein